MASFKHGSPLMVDYTPGSDVSAGDVVVIGATPYVAHLDIKANELGALAALGGVYSGAPDIAIAGGVKVFWDGTNFTATATANDHFGYSTPAGSGGGTVSVDVVHNPTGTNGS